MAATFRQTAMENMQGRWGTLALTYLIFTAVSGACSALSYIVIGGVLLLIVSGPLQMGLTMQSLHVVRQEPVDVRNAFDGFKRFTESFVAYLLLAVFTFLWSLLFIIPGIIKAYSYSMTYYILADNPGMSANEARKRSMQMMHGNKWRLFCLQFSFIGWFLLCILTCGILTFWVGPYVQAATAAFYQSIAPESLTPPPPAQPKTEEKKEEMPEKTQDAPIAAPSIENDEERNVQGINTAFDDAEADSSISADISDDLPPTEE